MPPRHPQFRRAEGSNLYLDEFSADSDLSQSSLCIVFSQSMVIPGTQLLNCRGTLVLVVPTQCAIHRFFIHAWQEGASVNQSLLSKFPRDEELPASHDFYFYSVAGVAGEASIALSKDSKMLAAVKTSTSELALVVMPMLGGSRAGIQRLLWSGASGVFVEPPVEEILRAENVLKRMLAASEDTRTFQAVLAPGVKHDMIYSVHKDGKLRAWVAQVRFSYRKKNPLLRNVLAPANAVCCLALSHGLCALSAGH